MKSILSTLAVAALFTLAPVSTWAAGDCGCNKKCATACASGHGEKCKCKTCDCAKTGKCEHGKCDLKEKGKAPEAAPEKKAE